MEHKNNVHRQHDNKQHDESIGDSSSSEVPRVLSKISVTANAPT
jgi:hypothetical protein